MRAHFQDAPATVCYPLTPSTCRPYETLVAHTHIYIFCLFPLSCRNNRGPAHPRLAYGVGGLRTATFGSEQPNTRFRYRGINHHLVSPKALSFSLPRGVWAFPTSAKLALRVSDYSPIGTAEAVVGAPVNVLSASESHVEGRLMRVCKGIFYEKAPPSLLLAPGTPYLGCEPPPACGGDQVGNVTYNPWLI